MNRKSKNKKTESQAEELKNASLTSSGSIEPKTKNKGGAMMKLGAVLEKLSSGGSSSVNNS